jgi:hypothetical protein
MTNIRCFPALSVFLLIMAPSGQGYAQFELSAADREAVFTAAGFKAKGEDYVLCEDDVTASYMPGRIELADLNRDGQPEAWVMESSLFCYGNTAEYFVLLKQDSKGAWVKLLDEVGVPLELESRHNDWPDIEVGGPGAGPFPVYFHDGSGYVRGR